MERMIAVRNQKTIYRDGDRCIKVFTRDYSKADILNEALMQARIEEIGLRIPRVMEVTTVNGCWAIVSEFIKGKTLAQLMQENGEEIEKYLTMYADLQLEVHSKSCPLLPRLKERLIRRISRAELAADMRCKLLAGLEGMPEKEQVCHGDFTPSNIIVAGDGTPYILDWAHASQGNAAADAACTFLLMQMSGDTEGAQKYLELFCQKSHTPRQQVHQWLPIVAAAQFANSNAGGREFLLRWMDVAPHQ